MREQRSHGNYLQLDEWACLQWDSGTLPEDDGDSQWLEVNWKVSFFPTLSTELHNITELIGLDGRWILAQTRPPSVLVQIQIQGWIWALFFWFLNFFKFLKRHWVWPYVIMNSAGLTFLITCTISEGEYRQGPLMGSSVTVHLTGLV